MINNFLIMDGNGIEIDFDASEDAVAFCCEICGHPLLASMRDGKPGSAFEIPAECKDCSENYFLDVPVHAEKIYIFRVEGF